MGKAPSPTRKTRHHLVPSSRCSQKETKKRKNIRLVERYLHEAWHTLFVNMTPFEIVVCIVKLWSPPNYFSQVTIKAGWEDNIYEFHSHSDQSTPEKTPQSPFPDYHISNILMIAVYEDNFHKYPHLWHRLFGNKPLIGVIDEIVNYWSPNGYFTYVCIEAKWQGETLKFLHQN